MAWGMACMAWVIHGLSKVFAMVRHALPLYVLLATTPETALWPFQGWPLARRAASGRLTTHLDTPCHMGLEVRLKGERRDCQIGK
jgi:hypothetical protein